MLKLKNPNSIKEIKRTTKMFLRHFHRVSKLACVESNQIARIQQFHLSAAKCDTPENKNLNQFFEDPKNLKENVIRVGRQWNKDELRQGLSEY